MVFLFSLRTSLLITAADSHPFMRYIRPIEWSDSDDKSPAQVEDLPDTCPVCQCAVEPLQIFAYANTKRDRSDPSYGQVTYRCPRESCRSLFIGYFTAEKQQFVWTYRHSKPLTQRKHILPKSISSISKSFASIYNEAYAAEQNELKQICGSGYKKALEFLVKDYLIKKNPDKEEVIKNSYVGDCIQKHITTDAIKSVAIRAAWLANDESHYTRKWEDKDLTDLKRLIQLVVDWVDIEVLTEEAVKEMPEKAKK